MSSRHELIGVYNGLKHPSCCWQNDDSTEAIIGRVITAETAGEFIQDEKTIKGSIYPGQLVRGLTYRFYGLTKSHDKYGEQFVFDSFVVEQPAGEEAIVAYLTQCRGIGPVIARSIFSEFGDESVMMLREHAEEVVAKVPKLSHEKAIQAKQFLKESEKTERTKMTLLGLLKGRGFPKKVVDKAIDEFGAEAATIIARNPYILMRFKGCGFLKTDKMYLNLGLNPSRMKRQALCCWHAIAKQSGGDTWFRFFEVQNHLRQNVSSAKIDIERAMTLAVRSKMLSEKYHGGQRWVAEYNRDQQEQKIADLIDEANRELADHIAPLLWGHVADQITDVSDHQVENARLATSSFIGVLAGRPGTGKTYTVARIVRLLRDQFGENQIAIAAPTGKAAVRVTAAMEAVGLGLRATTLHSLLEFRGDGFGYNRERPLPFMFIIVDESSMIDTAMMKTLLEARAEGSHVLFVGDPNQLAPVGHGAPLRDLIAADVPHGELKEIQRNSGRIVKACGEIIDRSRLVASPKIDLAAGENLLLIERDSAEVQIDTLAAVMTKYQRDATEAKPDAIDPVWDIQVVVAVNAKSELGRKPLNLKLQELLNPEGRRVAGNPFRVGDKIINTKNASYKSAIKEEVEPINTDFIEGVDNSKSEPTPGVYVANGEQAEVIEVDSAKIIARLTLPDRTILIPRSARHVSEDGDEPDRGDEESEESTGSGCSWELGYAISCHKSQGSEWPIVIVMIDDYNGAKRVQSKQWLYTGISRAKKLCLMVGQHKTANACCSRDALFQRKTFLQERIIELRNRVAPVKPIEFTDEVLELLLGVN